MKSVSKKSQKVDRELHDLWNQARACDDDFECIEILLKWQERLRVLEGRRKNGRPKRNFDPFDED